MNHEPTTRANSAMTLAAAALRNEARALAERAEWCSEQADHLDMLASEAFAPVSPARLIDWSAMQREVEGREPASEAA